nr:unnamed protein product [Callosobruchus analis]
MLALFSRLPISENSFDIDQPESYEIVTDEHMIALIEAVSQYPEIYDPKNELHRDQDILYRVWKEVGRDLYLVNVRGHYCKFKWRGIKNAYLAYFRKKSNGFQVKYKYADYLHWLDPYIEPIKPRDPKKTKYLKNSNPKKVQWVKAAKSNAVKKPSNASKSSSTEKCSEPGPSTLPTDVIIEDEEKPNVGDTTSATNDTASPRSSDNIVEQNGANRALYNEAVDNDSLSIKMEPLDVDLFEVPESNQEHRVSQRGEEDPDMLFLKSIWSDLRKMSDRQKNVFKRKTMQLIGDILYPTI